MMPTGALLALVIAAAPRFAGTDPQVSAAFERLHRLHAESILARSTAPGFESAASRYLLARDAKSSRLAQLFRRVADDQFYRSAFSFEEGQKTFAPNLGPAQRADLDQLVGAATMAQDRSDTEWLKTQLGEIGWFTIRGFGKDADYAAWLLVQHADLDPAFQERVLAKLKTLLASGDTRPSNYAYLYDRVALARHRPQRYGTQIECTGPGKMAPQTVEDASLLDARRAAVGLEPEADYLRAEAGACVRDERASAPRSVSPGGTP